MLDVRVIGGTVIDGTGAPGRRADIGISDGRVVAVGDVDEQAARTIDADGLVVTPGFVDIHAHTDWIAPLPDGRQLLAPNVTQGITTSVSGRSTPLKVGGS